MGGWESRYEDCLQQSKITTVYHLIVSLCSNLFNRLYECSQCRNDMDALTKQKSFELEEFKRLHEEFQEQVKIVLFFLISIL